MQFEQGELRLKHLIKHAGRLEECYRAVRVRGSEGLGQLC
jgi:hypothetical protein